MMKKRELTEAELRAVQMVQLELLCEVDRICKKYNIHYNIIAGTLLGAVRHKGYIPWDDDADVAFLREEYEKFKEACEAELDQDKFYFQDHQETPGYRWGYGKLRRKGTVFLRQYQEMMPYEQGIFIDIFPLDTVSDIRVMRIWQNFHCFCIRKIMWAPIGKVAGKSGLVRRWYGLLAKIPEDQLWRHFEGLKKKYNKKPSHYVRILTFPTPTKDFAYKREWYENSAPIEFEKKQFSGVRDFDEYLSFKFGDYMKLPPVEARKQHPITELELPKDGIGKEG